MARFPKASFLCVAVLTAALCLGAAGCSDVPSGGENEEEEKKITEITDLSDESLVTLYGRNLCSQDGSVTFYNGASGFEVHFYGTSLAFSAYAYGEWDSMFSVLPDGETDSNQTIVTVKTGGIGYERIELAHLTEGEHTVKIIKRTDSYRTAACVGSVETDGTFLSAPERPSLKIAFYGDSITSGSGVLREVVYDAATGRYTDSGLYSAGTQNALQSYAYVAAQALGAEAEYYGRGGIAMHYSSGKTVLNNPSALAVDLDPEQYPYDYTASPPDVVVIYLGTNDYSIGMQNPSLGYSAEGLQVAFAQFIRTVIGTHYGTEIPIVLCSGMMVPAADLGSVMKNVKNMLTEFTALETVEFEACAVGHPVAAEDQAAGELLAEKIREMLGL